MDTQRASANPGTVIAARPPEGAPMGIAGITKYHRFGRGKRSPDWEGLSPARRYPSAAMACRHPLSASASANGSVALLSVCRSFVVARPRPAGLIVVVAGALLIFATFFPSDESAGRPLRRKPITIGVSAPTPLLTSPCSSSLSQVRTRVGRRILAGCVSAVGTLLIWLPIGRPRRLGHERFLVEKRHHRLAAVSPAQSVDRVNEVGQRESLRGVKRGRVQAERAHTASRSTPACWTAVASMVFLPPSSAARRAGASPQRVRPARFQSSRTSAVLPPYLTRRTRPAGARSGSSNVRVPSRALSPATTSLIPLTGAWGRPFTSRRKLSSVKF